jgi:hypothetical protein
MSEDCKFKMHANINVRRETLEKALCDIIQVT